MKAPLATLALFGALFVTSSAHAQDTFGTPTIDERAGELPPQAPPAVVAEPPPPPARPQKPGLPVALRFDGGYAYRKLFDLHAGGADFGLALGVQTDRHLAIWWASRLMRGDTNNGLDVWSFRTGAEIEGVFDPIRFGVGLSVLYIGVDRESRNETLTAYGVDGRAFMRFDAYRSDSVALFVRGSIDSGIDGTGNWAFWGPSVSLGVELGVAGQRKPEWR